MKKSLLVILALTTLTIANAQFSRDSIKSIRKSLPKGIHMEVDQMQGVIWIKSKKILTRQPEKDNYIQLYFAISETGKIGPLRFVNKITISSWVFMEKAVFLVGGSKMNKAGEQKRFIIYLGEVSRKVNSNASVTETSDIICSNTVFEFMEFQIEKRAFITIRYSGKEEYVNRPIFGRKAADVFNTILNAYEKYKT